MLKEYKEFKRAVNARRDWVRFCRFNMQKAIECNNEVSSGFWAKEYVTAIEKKQEVLGSNIKYAVIYKVTHRSG